MNTQFAQNFGWEIESRPVSFQKEGRIVIDPDFQVISRNDTDKVLSVMSSKYCPMLVNEFETATNRMLEASKMEFMGYQEFNDGKILLSILKNPNPLAVNSYPIEDYLVMGTSFNGEQPFFIGTSTILVRCQNSFSQIHMMSRTRHTKFSPEKREHILSGLEIYFKDRQRMYENFEKMQQVEVNSDQVAKFINKVLVIPEVEPAKGFSTRTINRRNELAECIRSESSELGNNVFGLFNGLTKFTSHVLKTKKEAPFGNLMGTANDINQRGYNSCLSMLEAA